MALLCDSTLRFIAFNFHPTLTVSFQQTYSMEISQSVINLTSENHASSETFCLHVTLLNQETSFSEWYYVLFVGCLGITLVMLQVRVKKEQRDFEKKEESQKVREYEEVEQERRHISTRISKMQTT